MRWRARLGLDLLVTASAAAARLEHLRAAGLGALADLGFLGLDDDSDAPVVVTGYKATRAAKLTPGQRRWAT